MTLDVLPQPAPSDDDYLAKAFRAIAAHEPVDGVLREIVEAARLQAKCSGAALAGRAAPRDASAITAGEIAPLDGIPSLAVPVLVNGRATHQLDFYGTARDQRFDPGQVEAAWRFAGLAGLVLAGTSAARDARRADDDEPGVVARHGFEDDVTAALEANDRRAGLVIARVHDLEHVNQQWGREVGDEVLRLVARAMLDAVGGAGTVGRLRRHEFGAVIPGADYAAANAVADRIRGLVEPPLPVLGLPDVWTNIAIGVAAATGGTTNSVVPILHATYRAVDLDERAAAHEPSRSRFGF